MESEGEEAEEFMISQEDFENLIRTEEPSLEEETYRQPM